MDFLFICQQSPLDQDQGSKTPQAAQGGGGETGPQEDPQEEEGTLPEKPS